MIEDLVSTQQPRDYYAILKFQRRDESEPARDRLLWIDSTVQDYFSSLGYDSSSSVFLGARFIEIKADDTRIGTVEVRKREGSLTGTGPLITGYGLIFKVFEDIKETVKGYLESLELLKPDYEAHMDLLKQICKEIEEEKNK